MDARVAAGVRDWARAGSGMTIPDNVIPGGIARDTEVTTAVGREATAREHGDSGLSYRIDRLPENELRVVAISGWDAGDNARNIQLAIYPPADIGGNTTLRFEVGGITLMASSGDGIDVNGGVVTLAVDAANSATLTRTAARAGHLAADWIYQGDV